MQSNDENKEDLHSAIPMGDGKYVLAWDIRCRACSQGIKHPPQEFTEEDLKNFPLMSNIKKRKEEVCGFNCGRPWNEEGGKDGFDDCVSAYHVKKSPNPNHNDILNGLNKFYGSMFEASDFDRMTEFVKQGLIQSEKWATGHELERIKNKLGFLRQWINEDRIDDSAKMITDEELKSWLID